MKQNSNRRSRSRGSNKKSQGKNNYDSNGPAGRVRGTAQQVLEKYQLLGRDAASSGDWIVAESCLQYAEHYYRIVSADIELNGKGQSPSEIANMREKAVDGVSTATEIPIVETGVDTDQNNYDDKTSYLSNEEIEKIREQEGRKERSNMSAGRSSHTNSGARRRRSRGKLEDQTSETGSPET